MTRMPHANLKLNEPVGDEVKTSTCYMCACRCGIKVHLKDGRVHYIQGNRDHPVNRGVLCAKGSAGIMQHYSPARLRKPLLRVGERGAGVFREIEWDEALDIATRWLGEIRKSDPDKLAFFTGRDQSQALTSWWAQQFGTGQPQTAGRRQHRKRVAAVASRRGKRGDHRVRGCAVQLLAEQRRQCLTGTDFQKGAP